MPNLGPDYALAKWLSDMDRRITLLESEQPLQGSSSTNPDGTTGLIFRAGALVSANFDGDLSVPSVGTQGVGIGGPHGAAVIGDLLLRPGSIGNDALTNPVTVLGTYVQVGPTGYTTATGTIVGSTSIVVPAGFTKVNLAISVVACGLNPGTAADNLWAGCVLTGAVSGSSIIAPMGVQPGLSTINSQTLNRTFTGLTPGTTITFNAEAWTTVAAWGSSSANAITLNATASFSR